MYLWNIWGLKFVKPSRRLWNRHALYHWCNWYTNSLKKNPAQQVFQFPHFRPPLLPEAGFPLYWFLTWFCRYREESDMVKEFFGRLLKSAVVLELIMWHVQIVGSQYSVTASKNTWWYTQICVRIISWWEHCYIRPYDNTKLMGQL